MYRFVSLVCLLLATLASGEPLLVFAAVSTASPLTEAGKVFGAETGQEVSFSFGASSDLARQIQAGAPVDVFLSADVRRMDQLISAGKVTREGVVTLLSNELVIVVPRASKLEIQSAEDLAKVKTLALAEPSSVPAGLYAREWLEKKKRWSELEQKVVPTLDARAALAAVEAGRADAAIVYRTDARVSDRVHVAYAIPAGEQPRIVYPVAALTSRGAAFVKFLQSERGRALFTRAGFLEAK